MEILAEIIRSIAVIVILSLCLELLLPKSELQPYIRTVTGLLLIIAVLYPLKNAEADLGFEALLSKNEYNTQQIISAGTELYADWEEEAAENHLQSISSQMKSILLLDNDIIDLSVNCYYSNENMLTKLEITAKDISENKQKKWRETLNIYFGIPIENIDIELISLQEAEKGNPNE